MRHGTVPGPGKPVLRIVQGRIMRCRVFGANLRRPGRAARFGGERGPGTARVAPACALNQDPNVFPLVAVFATMK